MRDRRPARREETIVVAAHPDDEVVGAAAQLAREAPPIVVHVTDGAPRDMHDARRHGFATREDYARARAAEAQAALALAGIDPERVVALEIADQEAMVAVVQVARRLARLFALTAPGTVFTHPYEGGHPDHDAVALATHAACALLSREHGTASLPELWEFTSYHAAPDGRGMRAGAFLDPNQAAPGAHADDVVVELAPAMRARKSRMVHAFTTQAQVLAAFPVEHERYRRAPRYRFTVAPHDGRLFYEHHSWGLEGAGWRKLARAALAELSLGADHPL